MCIVVLQLGAGGVAHRIMRLQRVCSPAASTSTFIALALLTPLYEELIYRGALSLVFANRMNSSSHACCAVVPALFFAAMHNSSNLNATELLHHYAFGCCVGARALVAGSTWHAACIHVVHNAVVVCAQTAATHGAASLAPATDRVDLLHL